MHIPSTDVLIRAYYAAALGLFPDVGQSMGIVVTGTPLMQSALPASPVFTSGRLYHAVQVTGLATGQQVQVQASLDGVNWVNLGAAIVANGITQLPTGAYTYMRAILSTPAGTTTAEILTAGETDIDLTNAASFSATGGRALLDGTDLISYTGKTVNTLNGVPATGEYATDAHASGVSAIPADVVITLLSFR